VEQIKDQDTTDLQKCITCIVEEEEKRKIVHDDIIVVGGLGGCLSHTLANINVLFQYSHRKIVLVGTENVGVLCRPNHSTQIQVTDWKKYKYCSLIPIGASAKGVHSEGMRWNLDNSTLEFGGLVSTSNEMTCDSVSITATSQPLLWILDISH